MTASGRTALKAFVIGAIAVTRPSPVDAVLLVASIFWSAIQACRRDDQRLGVRFL